MPAPKNTQPGRRETSPGQRTRASRPPLADAAKLGKPPRPRHAATQLGPYLWRVPMSSGVWAVSTDEALEAPLPRGLYQQERDTDAESGDGAAVRYSLRSALPYVHARIIRRDGSGRQSAVDYLISADKDGPRAVVTHHQVRTGEWAGAVSIPLSDDPKIVAAAGTAIRYMRPIDADRTEREAVPRSGPDGRVMIPAPETLPAGYLATGPLPRAEALRQWRETIVPVAAANPDFALILGGSAISPFAGWLDYADTRAFIVDLAGEPNGGKSTTVRTAGAIWGAVPKDGTGVVGPWNLSAQGPGRALGMLGILPAIFDEQGVSGYNADQWARIILAITDGSRRAADRNDGLRVSLPYSGVVISAGNASIMAGLGAGRYAGIGPKRVNTLAGPFTGSAEQAESVKPVLRDAHGHPGRVILEKFSGADVARTVAEVGQVIGSRSGVVARSAAKNMHMLAAGAAMLDLVFGTGTMIRDSAIKGALAYLAANCAEPEHDTDRMLSLLRESIASEPRAWPTVAEYREHKLPPAAYGEHGPTDPNRIELPRHGVGPVVLGVRADDGSWFAVFGEALDGMLTRAGADRAIALVEAERRGWLHRTASDRRNSSMATVVKHVGRMIRFALQADGDDQDVTVVPEPPSPAATVAPEPETPPGCPECDTTLPFHLAGCSQAPPEPWPGDDGHQDQDHEHSEPAAIAPAEMPGPPFAAEVRAYLAECAASSGLDRRYHPTPDGAVKSIGHHGKAEADMIRAAYAEAASSAPSPAEAPAAEPEPITAAEPEAPHGADPEAATAAPEHATDDDELAAFTHAVRKVNAEATDAGITAGLAIFHTATGGVRWVSYAGQVGQAWFAMLAAKYPSMKPPAPLASAKVAEITEAGPRTRVNYAAKPKITVRPGKHHVTSYDLNGQHMAAAGSAELGDGEPTVIATPRNIEALTGFPGYVRLARGLRTGHPAFGTIPAGEWVAMPLVRFLARDLGLTIPAAEVVYWPDHGRRMSVYASRYRDARERLMTAEPTEGTRIALAALKSQANAFIGMFHSKTYSHGGFYRPDWYDQIVATAEANALRALAKCPVAPVAKMADSAYWIADTEPYVPEGLTISGQLGKWKLDRHGPVTDDLIAAFRETHPSPASVRDAVIAIDAERRAGQ
ncbi:MAG: hypothetical protein ACRDPD_02750 [Streptosporangiaceae bacterium]